MDQKLRSRVEILRDFHIDYQYDPRWEGFINLHDLGIPLAVLVVHGMAEPTKVGEEQILETWNALCMELGVDPDGDYTSVDDVMGDVPQ